MILETIKQLERERETRIQIEIGLREKIAELEQAARRCLAGLDDDDIVGSPLEDLRRALGDE